MPTPVSDSRSNSNDQVAHAAAVIGRSEHRRLVFSAVCAGKKRIKTVDEVASSTGLTRKQVLDSGKALVHNQLMGQTRREGDTAYEKDDFYAHRKRQILGLAGDPKKLEALPTKTRPATATSSVLKIELPRSLVKVKHVTIDDISSFRAVGKVPAAAVKAVKMPESQFKEGFQAVISEQAEFKDWGGEMNDVWTTNLRVGSKRVGCAVAFKGPGQTGPLTPGKMGKNGDQIQRLFAAPADLFLVQYWSTVKQSVYDQMHALAVARSVQSSGSLVMYGVIDGVDSARMISAYPEEFRMESK